MSFVIFVLLSWTLVYQKAVVSGSFEEPSILVAGHEGIYFRNTSDKELFTVVNTSSTVYAIDYHLQSRQGYAIWNDEIHRFHLPVDDRDSSAELTTEFVAYVTSRCPTFAVDWVHHKIFYPDCYSHTIYSIDIDKPQFSQDRIIKLPQGAWAMDMVIDPYKGLLFWTTGATLMSCHLDGRELRKVVPEFPVNRVSSLALDLAAERVYFCGQDKHDKNSSNLYYTSYNGKTSHSLPFYEFEGGVKIFSFGVFSSHLYYITENNSNSHEVLELKIEFVRQPKIFLQTYFQITRLRLVHPQLQTPGTVDQCTHHGCSHLCLLEGSQPHCFCPRWYVLDHDNITCIFDPDEDGDEPLFVKVAWGVVLVLIVLLGAGVLMCLCDKLWTNLHPTEVRLRVTRTFSGAWTQDGVHLI